MECFDARAATLARRPQEGVASRRCDDALVADADSSGSRRYDQLVRRLALLVAAVPLALAPSAAVAATPLGPSARGCAQAFDAARNAAVRARVARSPVLAVQIFATSIPTCVVKFQLPSQRVLTAQATWSRGTASAWKVSIRPHGRVAGRNGRWAGGRLTATAADAARIVSIGPPPTTASCIRSWNAGHPAGVATLGPAPVYVAPLPGNLYVARVGGQGSETVRAPGCTVTVLPAGGHDTLFISSWSDGAAAGWERPPGVSGILGRGIPNADLAADGRLTSR
jgi:hypothetical protein